DTAAELGSAIVVEWPFAGGTRPVVADPTEALLARTWRPTLSTIGIDGIPSIADGGNVLRPRTAASLSFRLPPGLDPERGLVALREVLTADVPHGAEVRVEVRESAAGWEAPEP